MTDQISTVLRTDTALGRIAREATARAAGAAPAIVETVESEADARARLEAQRTARLAWWGENLPARYRDASLDGLRPQQQPDRLRRWLTAPEFDPERLTLLLWGDSRRGKTHAAYAVGNAAVEDGAVAVAWTTLDLMMALRDNARVERTWDRLESADLVVLDDLGREYDGTGWALSQVHRLVDMRHRERKRLVVTTNLGYDDLITRYGDPIIMRLVDEGVVLRFDGDPLTA